MNLTWTRIWFIVVPMGLVATPGATAQGAGRPVDFGRQWVRSHPYTLMGLCGIPDLDVDLYREPATSAPPAKILGS